MAEVSAKIEIIGVDKISPSLRQVQGKMGGLARSIQQNNKAIADSFRRIKDQNQGFFRTFKYLSVAATGSATAALYKSIRAGAKFEQAIANLSAETGIAGKSLIALKQKALQFSNESGKPAENVVEVFNAISNEMVDISNNAEALSNVTRNVLLLSKATGMELPDAVRIATSALKQFGGSSDQANHFVNVLASGSGDVQKTAEALLKVGVTAKQSGLSIEQTTAMIQALAKAGISGGEGGTALEAVLNRLQKLGNKKFNPAIVGMGKSLDNLGKANLTTAQRIKIFGLQNQTAAGILIKQRGTVKQWANELINANAAQEKASIRSEGLEERLVNLGNSFQNSLIQVFGSLEPHLDPVLKKLEGFAKSFDSEKFAKEIGKFAKSIANTVDTLGGLEGVLTISGTALKLFITLKAISLVKQYGSALREISGKVSGIGTAAMGSATGVGKLGQALRGLAVAGEVTAIAHALGVDTFLGNKIGGAINFEQDKKAKQLSGEAKLRRLVPDIEQFKLIQSAIRLKPLPIPEALPFDPMGKAQRPSSGLFGSISNLGKVLSGQPIDQGGKAWASLAAKLEGLAQSITSQQATLKKPQQIDLRIRIDSPVSAKVTGLKASGGASVGVDVGQMIP